ncbi:MAG: hypothetical protein K2K89_08710 [Ruminococcus sp.]|nr:hypothetical protein [Ruminococcus sp.]
MVKWYTTNGEKLSIYSLNPFNLKSSENNSVPGDVNGDGAVTMKDVVLINRYLAAGWDVILK